VKGRFYIVYWNTFRKYSVVFLTELLNINSLQISLHADRYIIISFAADSCLHIQISGSPTLLTASNRSTKLCQSSLQPAHSLSYISVPDTRTNFNFCCSLNYKRNHLIVHYHLALKTDVLLGSGLDRFIPVEEV